MIDVSILQDDDIVLPTDWCRPLSLTTMSGGMSDDYSFESCYTGRPENNVKWCQVGLIFPAWADMPLKKLKRNVFSRFGYYEVVRGKLPRTHIHPNGRVKK